MELGKEVRFGKGQNVYTVVENELSFRPDPDSGKKTVGSRVTLLCADKCVAVHLERLARSEPLVTGSFLDFPEKAVKGIRDAKVHDRVLSCLHEGRETTVFISQYENLPAKVLLADQPLDADECRNLANQYGSVTVKGKIILPI